jgi:signal transduction histidine kinase
MSDTNNEPKKRSLLKSVSRFFYFYSLFRGKEDYRQSYILNTILIGLLIMAVCGQIVWITSYLFYNRNQNDMSLINTLVPSFFIVLSLILLKLSRMGHYKIAASILIDLLFLAILESSIKWGVNVPMSIGIYSLIIFMSAILIGPQHGIVFMLIISASLLIIFHLQKIGYLEVNESWKEAPSSLIDVIILDVNYFVIGLVSWLSGKEIIRSLKQARSAEKKAVNLAIKLKKQNISLETEVNKRTKEVREYQLQRMMDLNNLAEFGKISAGLLHDIKNPLTVISLNLDSLKQESCKLLKNKGLDILGLINQSLTASKTVESIIKSSQKQLVNEESKEHFDLNVEIKNILLLLTHTAERQQVKLIFQPEYKNQITGFSVKLSRIIANIIMNSIDSFKNIDRVERFVRIEIKKEIDKLFISVIDNGCGIKREDRKMIFRPFYTSKKSHERTGVGLYISQNIIKDYFGGEIKFTSTYGKGSQFDIIIPN